MNKLLFFYQQLNNKIEFISPVFQLGVRFFLFNIFFISGLTKIQSWETTKMLFAYEYNVPFLNSELAAWMGTAVELILPVLLLIGIFSRPSALVLLLFNVIASMSYPDISPAGIVDHIMWSVMLTAIFFHGAGKLSFDNLILNKVLEQKITKLKLNRQAELLS